MGKKLVATAIVAAAAALGVVAASSQPPRKANPASGQRTSRTSGGTKQSVIYVDYSDGGSGCE